MNVPKNKDSFIQILPKQLLEEKTKNILADKITILILIVCLVHIHPYHHMKLVILLILMIIIRYLQLIAAYRHE